MFQLTYPIHGRGAWASTGGTLSGDGTRPGAYYRSPAGAALMPGIVGYRAVRGNTPVDVNSYAVYMAIKSIQRELGVDEDGLFGPGTGAALKTWQGHHGLEQDGVFGRTSSRAMFRSIAADMATKVDSSATVLSKLTLAHVGFESDWDPGAVGYVQSADLGLGQINGPAHPDLTPEYRLTPRMALPWVVGFVLDNLESMLWNERDAIAAYNLGVGGAEAWIAAGRPAVFHGVDVAGYIAGVLANS